MKDADAPATNRELETIKTGVSELGLFKIVNYKLGYITFPFSDQT